MNTTTATMTRTAAVTPTTTPTITGMLGPFDTVSLVPDNNAKQHYQPLQMNPRDGIVL